jgi:hypothetical protein
VSDRAMNDFVRDMGRVYNLFHGREEGSAMVPYEDEVTVFDADGNGVRCRVRVYSRDAAGECLDMSFDLGEPSDVPGEARSHIVLCHHLRARSDHLSACWPGSARRFDVGTLYPIVRELRRLFLAHQTPDAP